MKDRSRRERILELLKEEGEKTPKELAATFGVSLMTIYRDIKELEREGLIERKHGTVKLKENDAPPKECFICHKDVDGRQNFIFFLRSGKKLQTCCPHCGLMAFDRLEEEPEAVLTKDFITSNPVNALDGWYVVGAKVAPCCSPSAFAFADRETARMFAKGFGGKVLSLSEAVKEIKRLMSAGVRVELKL
ncbi:MAG: DeoR/GlpR transcriptional regulator [Aquificae bacterium]|nr:DeoR/GlpR transcriptional regulator [Aquificota bacterium]